MKLGPVTKLNNRNKKPPKNLDDDLILVNCDVIAIFSNLRPIWKNTEAGFRTDSL